MSELGEHYELRDKLTERLRADVLGPIGGDHEILDEEPATAYVTGVLYPAHRNHEDDEERLGEQDVDLAPAALTVDEVPDTGVAMANRQMPSAMGITFAVDTEVSPDIVVKVSAAIYEPIDAEGRVVVARRSETRATDQHHGVRWRRRPLSPDPITVPLDRSTGVRRMLDDDGLELRVRVRGVDDGGHVTVTATLVNTRSATRKDLLDARCYFQPGIRIEVPNGRPALVERAGRWIDHDEELAASRLLHRHAPMFASGHGCAADWDWQPPPPRGRRQGTRAATAAVWTTFVPTRDVLLTDSNPDIDEPGMYELATASTADLLARLEALVAGYRTWIEDRTADSVALVGTEFEASASEQLAACREACRRMGNGIERLRRDPVALTAFRLANEAMAEQRARTAWLRGGRQGEPDLHAGRWRPFQIGFLLLCLEGIVDHEHPDRRLADLLWFPTGGGKTEAYLGLIAFTTFLRRMRDGDAGGGTTVLMRYTLRLLTLQQFERAATLICAMERLRRAKVDVLRTEPFSIGMWVGQAATPNRLVDAAAALKDLRDGREPQQKNPVQLRSCPWCGTSLDHHDYHVDPVAGTMSIECRNDDCPFRSGLPVHVVDEVIYAVRPTLVIATADKFAQIAWRQNVARLFNREDSPEGTRPPELVIQDELHLISGPLGSLAGLYETAIDIAADGPKIIASTATIRRAAAQGRRLFDREVKQFPPAGLDARDSWFAVEAPREQKASRLYVGLFSPSTSQATLLIRAYAALLHYAHNIDGDDRVRDAYWTLVGYFNSLRLLSAAELQVLDDVNERLKQLAARTGGLPRPLKVLAELTSRVESSRIPQRLQELFVGLGGESEPIDVVLATNMISVGVDVDRLGLMAVMGQPQTTAEYIQATSRVGRQYPGLVVTLFNSARSRDRSHYENFVAYHSALYQQVESTSVTPFAARSRDRALHAVLVGLTRLLHPQARPNEAAARIEDFLEEVYGAKDRILDRVRAVAPDEERDCAEELDVFVDHWRALAEGNDLRYEADRPRFARRSANAALLRAFEQDEDLEEAYPTMWSLRDVDVESPLYLED